MRHCTNLTVVDISMTDSSLISIGRICVQQLYYVNTITIPNNVKNIGNNPFNLYKLTTINISNDIFSLDGSNV